MAKLFFLHLQTSSTQKNYNTPVTDFNNWTRIISISWSLTNEFQDKKFGSGSCMVKPQGFTIEREAEEFHGVTNANAINDGQYIQEILSKISVHLEKVNIDYFVGHNIEFHLNVLRSELLRHSFKDLDVKNTICLMKSSVSTCKIPSNSGYKYPTLSELNNYLFDKEDNFRSNKYGNWYQYCSILNCYDKLFNDNVFINLGLIPDSKIDLINIPFKKDNFPTQNKLEIVNISNCKNDILYDGVKLFSQIDSIENYEKWGMYILSNKNGRGEIEYILIDYRGIIILRTFDRQISLTSYPYEVEDKTAVFVENVWLLDIIFYAQGLFISRNNSYYYNNYTLDKTYIIIEYNEITKTLIDCTYGRILFEKTNLLLNKHSKYIITYRKINENLYANLCNYDSNISIFSFDLNNKKLLETTINDEYNYIHFLKDSKKGIIDLKGNTLINNFFDELKEVDIDINDVVFKFKNVNKHGFIDLNAQIIFEVDFDFDFEIFDDLILITSLNLEKNTKGIISKRGKIILPLIYDKIDYLNEEARFNNSFHEFKNVPIEGNDVLFKFKNANKHGFIDSNAQIIFEVDFEFEFEFFDELIVITSLGVQKNAKGIISRSGKIILEIIYDEIEYQEDSEFNSQGEVKGDYFELKRNNKNGLYLVFNGCFFDTIYDDIEVYNYHIKIYRNELEGLYRRNGEIIFDCNYRFGTFYDYEEFQFIEIKDNNFLSLVNLQNLECEEKNYEKSIKIKRNNEFILLSKKGDFVKLKCYKRGLDTDYIYGNPEKHIDFSLHDRRFFIDFYSYNDERLIMFKNGLYGFVDINFKEVIPFRFSNATPFKNGSSDVVIDGKSFKIDKFGNILN